MRQRHPLYERLGRFFVSIDDRDSLPDWLQTMMQRVIILDVRSNFERDGVEYVALCPQFNRVLPGTAPMEYSVIIEGGRFLRFETGGYGKLSRDIEARE